MQLTAPMVITPTTPSPLLLLYGLTAPTSATIVLPTGWAVDKTGNLTINEQQPTSQQAIDYANALIDYNEIIDASSTVSQTPTTLPPEPNWYSLLSKNPSTGPAIADLAVTLGITPKTFAQSLPTANLQLQPSASNLDLTKTFSLSPVASPLPIPSAQGFRTVSSTSPMSTTQPSTQGQNLNLAQLATLLSIAATNPNFASLLSSPYVSQYLNSQYISPAINNYLQTLNSPTLQTLEQAYANILQQQRNQAEQTGGYPTAIPGYTISNNPNYWLASFAAFPGTLQNVAADANQALGKIYNYFTGNPYTQYIPFNPMGNILNPSLNQVAPYLQAFANQYGQNILPAPFPPWLGQDIVKGAFTNPISFITNAASGISNQQTPTLQYYLDLLGLLSSGYNPGTAFEYGVANEALGKGISTLLGTPNNSIQNYGFGAATAPFFEAAGLLGNAASKALLPVENQYQPVLDLIESGELKSATNNEVQNFVKTFIAANPNATNADLLKGIEEFIVQRSEGTSANLGLDAIQNQYIRALQGLGRLGIRTAPVSSLFGAMSAAPSYIAGNRNWQTLSTKFGLGYLGGTILQLGLPAVLSELDKIRLAQLNLDPSSLIWDLKGTPYVSEEGHLYYPVEINTPEGKLPARFLLSTTQQVQAAADLTRQIDSAAEMLGADSKDVQSALISNLRTGTLDGNMSPEKFYSTIKSSLEGSYISHATPSNFPEQVANKGAEVKPPDSAQVGDALRKAFNDLQGLYSAPSTSYGVPQVYNYLGLNPTLSENLNQVRVEAIRLGL